MKNNKIVYSYITLNILVLLIKIIILINYNTFIIYFDLIIIILFKINFQILYLNKLIDFKYNRNLELFLKFSSKIIILGIVLNLIIIFINFYLLFLHYSKNNKNVDNKFIIKGLIIYLIILIIQLIIFGGSKLILDILKFIFFNIKIEKNNYKNLKPFKRFINLILQEFEYSLFIIIFSLILFYFPQFKILEEFFIYFSFFKCFFNSFESIYIYYKLLNFEKINIKKHETIKRNFLYLKGVLEIKEILIYKISLNQKFINIKLDCKFIKNYNLLNKMILISNHYNINFYNFQFENLNN